MRKAEENKFLDECVSLKIYAPK